MTQEEIKTKIFKAIKDIEKCSKFIDDFYMYKTSEINLFVANCQLNTDYFPYILLEKNISNMSGNVSFADLDFNLQVSALAMIKNALHTYLNELNLQLLYCDC